MEEQAESTLGTVGQEIYNDLTNDQEQQSEVQEEVTKEVEETNQEVIQEEPEQVESENTNVLSSEYVKEFGLPKEFIGKPVTELGKSYRNLLGKLTEQGQTISQLKKSKVENTEKEVVVEEKDFPDPVEFPEEFKKALKDFRSKVKDELRREILNEVEPTLKPAQEIAMKNQQIEISKAISNGLEGVEAKEAITLWSEQNPDLVEAIKNGDKTIDTNFFIKDVINTFKANQYDSLKENNGELIKNEVHKKLKNELTKQPKFEKTVFSKQKEIKQRTLQDEIYADLVEKANF